MDFSGGTVASTDGVVQHASKAPLYVGALVFIFGCASIPAAFILESRGLFIIGYIATPLLSLLCVAWDSLAQRKGSRNPWFSINKRASAILRVVAGASFVPAGIHIWNIAAWLGEQAVQGGWFS